MMDSLYELSGDLVKAQITFVPHHKDTELRCEASNEALNQPISKTIVIAVQHLIKPSAEPLLSSETMADDASSEVNPKDDYDYSHFEYVNKYFENQFEKQEYEVIEDENDYQNKLDDYEDKHYSYIDEELTNNHIDRMSEEPVRSESTASDTVHNLSSPDQTEVISPKQNNVFTSPQSSSAHSYRQSAITILSFALIARTLVSL